MLDQLDDPVPFTVSPELVTAAKSRGTHLRRRHRVAVTGAMIPVVLVLAMLAGAVYVDHRLDEVDRVDVAAGVLAPVVAGQPFNVLVVGTDEVGGHSDVILLVHVNASAERLDVVSLPRDLVFDDATGTTDRLSTFLPNGGPSALISAIHNHLGVEISHFVEIDFAGFQKLIDAAGGVSIKPSTPLRDAGTGLALDDSCQHLDGARALQLARSRQVEYRAPDGGWQVEPSGDLGRIQRQQTMLAVIFQQMQSMPTDLSTLSTLMDVVADNTMVDAGFDRRTMLGLVTKDPLSPMPDVADLNGALKVEPFTLPNGEAVLRPTADASSVLEKVLTIGESDDHANRVLPPFSVLAGPPQVADQFGFEAC